MLDTTEWRKGNLGWSRLFHSHRLSIRAYNSFPSRKNGKARKMILTYVPRIDNLSPTSPATAYRSLQKAKDIAEQFVVDNYLTPRKP